MQNEKAVYEYEFLAMYGDVNDNWELSNVGLLRHLQELGGFQTKKIFGSMLTPKGAWILLNWRVKKFKAIRWSEKFKVKTWPVKHTSLYSIRNYEVYNEQDEVVAIVSTKWVLMDSETKKLVRDIEEIASLYEEDEKILFEDDFPKLKEPNEIQYSYKHVIQRRDIDTNGHVNNVKYLELAYEALPEDVYANDNFKNIDIMYKHSAFLGEEMSIGFKKDVVDENEEYTIVIKSNEKLNAIIRLS